MYRLTFLGVCLGALGSVRASDPADEAVDVTALVKQLGSDDFATREAATEKLSALQVDAPPPELLAALESPDDEVRARAALAVKAIRARAVLRPLPRAERFVVRGQVDLYVASTAVLDLKADDERLWVPAFSLGAKAVAQAGLEGDRRPAGPGRAADFATYRRARNPEFVRTDRAYTRPKEDSKGQPLDTYHVAIQAAEVDAERVLTGLVVSRGPVRASSIQDSLILATGDVTASSAVCSVIISDGDIRLKGAQRCLIIARGKIEITEATGCTLIAGGAVRVARLPREQRDPLPIAPDTDPKHAAVLQHRREMVWVDIKEREPNPLSFITFFELRQVGLEAKAADTFVTVAKVAPGSASEKAGLKAGDVIVSVNGKAPADAESLRRLLRDALAVGDAVVKVRRGDQMLMLKVALPD